MFMRGENGLVVGKFTLFQKYSFEKGFNEASAVAKHLHQRGPHRKNSDFENF